jgi:hypothetical protein
VAKIGVSGGEHARARKCKKAKFRKHGTNPCEQKLS